MLAERDQNAVLWGPGCVEPGARLAVLGLPSITPCEDPSKLAGNRLWVAEEWEK